MHTDFSKIKIYTAGLLVTASALTFQVVSSHGTEGSLPLIVFFSALNVLAYMHPIPIVDKDEEKSVGIDFFINSLALLIAGPLTSILASVSGTAYSMAAGFLKREPLNWHRRAISLSNIAISVSLMGLSYSKLSGGHGGSLSGEDALPFLFSAALNFVLNSALFSLAISVEKGDLSPKSLLSLFNFFAWTYRYMLWDAIYVFLGAIALTSSFNAAGSHFPWGALLLGGMLLYPLKERINSLRLNVNYDRQNKVLHSLNSSLQDSNKAITRAFLASLDAKDPYTAQHSFRVSEYAVAVARRFEFKDDDIQAIQLAGLLHDVGKMKIPSEILNKPSGLSDEEYARIKEHPVHGLSLVRKIFEGTEYENDRFRLMSNIASLHHERYDGKGYPKGLVGEQIPLEARIIGLVDAFDAMTTARPYRETLSLGAALEEIKAKAGTQFCPLVVERFTDCIRLDKVRIL